MSNQNSGDSEVGEPAAKLGDKTIAPRKPTAAAAVMASTVIQKFLKSAPRPVRRPEEVARDQILAAPLFASLDAKRVLGFIKQGRCQVVQGAPRDQLIDAKGKFIVVLSGQLSLGRFDRLPATVQSLERARRLSEAAAVENKIARPLSSVADYNICQFGEGHVIDFEKIQASDLLSHSGQYRIELFSYTPTSYALFAADCFSELSASLPEAAQAALLLAQNDTQKRVPKSATATDTRADEFFIRNGLSVASTVRVLDLTKCIWCKKCEDACAEKYGTKRIDLEVVRKEPRLTTANLALAGTCRTCSDQRCVDACGYSAIRYDEKRQEVLILEDKCVGCSACANACPYHAIEMQKIVAGSYFNTKLSERLGNKKAAERAYIASKCDHCSSYDGVQACVAACPEGALLELSPSTALDLLRNRSQSPSAQPASVVIAPSLSSTNAIAAGAPPTRLAEGEVPRSYWLLGLGCWLFFLAQIVSLELGRGSIFSFTNRNGMIRPDHSYYAGNELSKRIAIFGTVLLTLAMFYPLLQKLQKIIPTRSAIRARWQQIFSANFHAFVGILGALLVLTHSHGRVFSVSESNMYSGVALIAFWLMIALLFTGWLGSRLYVASFMKRAFYEDKARKIESQLEAQVSPHAATAVPSLFAFAREFAMRRGAAAESAQNRKPATLRAAARTLWLLLFPVTPPRAELEAKLSLLAEQEQPVRAAAMGMLSTLCRFRLQSELWGQLAPLTQLLKRMHRPVALVFLIVAALHILHPN